MIQLRGKKKTFEMRSLFISWGQVAFTFKDMLKTIKCVCDKHVLIK